MHSKYAILLPAVFLLSCVGGCDLPRWKVAETQDLLIYYKPGSYAEKHLSEAEADYEGSFQLAEQFMPALKKTPKVKVYLYDTLKNKGFSRVRDREVHYRYGEVFRLTSAHEFLHIFLYELNPKAPIRIEEGACRIQEGKRKKFKGKIYQIMYYQLVKLSPPDRWTLQEAFRNEYKNDDEGNIAAAFVLFAMKELGPRQFWSFYEQLEPDNWQPLVKKFFGKDAETINKDFAVFVQNIPDPPEAFRYKYSPATAYLHQ